MRRVRYDELFLTDPQQRAAAAIGADAVIVMSSPSRVWTRGRGRRGRRGSPMRARRLESRRGALHGASDRDHTESWRDWLQRDAAELDIVREGDWAEVFRKFNRVSEDAGMPLPTKRDRRLENWGDWAEAIRAQIENASDAQIAYYADAAYFIREHCPVCDKTGEEQARS